MIKRNETNERRLACNDFRPPGTGRGGASKKEYLHCIHRHNQCSISACLPQSPTVLLTLNGLMLRLAETRSQCVGYLSVYKNFQEKYSNSRVG